MEATVGGDCRWVCCAEFAVVEANQDLALPHLLMAPFVISNTMWRTGLAGAPPIFPRLSNMAKAVTIKVKLVSSADTGFYYVAKKNSRTMTEKLVKKKYDPVARKHVEFREAKIK